MGFMTHARKAVSFALLFKASSGLAMTTLALFGYTMPKFGFDVTLANGTAAAAVGALLGATLAVYA